jgi:hypothetical protein
MGLAACSQSPDTMSAPNVAQKAPTVAPARAAAIAEAKGAHAEEGIAWRKGDVNAAFAEAKAAGKPVFLYWGAVWCPPCNEVKATIFNRRDFIERSRFFVPVYLDGDSKSAQKEGARFKVSGYPTMILFTPDGTEITRLPGEVDADQYMRVLGLGMNGARPVKATIAAALAPKESDRAALTPDDWRMLAYYSWVTDEQQLVPKKDVAATLMQLAKACPADQGETATRLELQAIAAAAEEKNKATRADAAASDRVIAALSDAKVSRENFDMFVYYAGNATKYLTKEGSPERSRLVTVWNAALDRFVADSSLATADRLAALDAKIELAKLETSKGPLPDTLLASVREQTSRADRETTDLYARQAVISAAAEVLADAGLMEESDALLTGELKRSHSPYYMMLGLAANAKKRGDKSAALEWTKKAYAAADGPATRLQWGVGYVKALIELSPNDASSIESAAQQVIGELEPKPETFYERNRRALERMGRELNAWNKTKQHEESLRRIRKDLASVCVQLPAADPARATCNSALSPAKA